jgi:integrase
MSSFSLPTLPKPLPKDFGQCRPDTPLETTMAVHELNDTYCKTLKLCPAGQQRRVSQTLEQGLTLYLLIGSTRRAWYALRYAQGGKQIKTRLEVSGVPAQFCPDAPDHMDCKTAKAAARKLWANGTAPQAKTGNLLSVCEDWFKEYAVKSGLRRACNARQIIDYDIATSKWAAYPFRNMGRDQYKALFKEIESKPRKDGKLAPRLSSAQAAYALLFRICNWFAKTSDGYVCPINSAMQPDKRTMAEKSRDRVLSDDEIVRLWRATEHPIAYHRLLRFALLTGQRREKLSTLRWTDLQGNLWTVRCEPKEKGNIRAVRLPALAMACLTPNNHEYCFGNGHGFTAWSASKATLDESLDIAPWVQHDLRRSCRSIMSKLKIAPHIAELCIGHSIHNAVGQIYDRYAYLEEKSEALQAVADYIGKLVR